MAILTFRSYAEMPEPERLRRIGELIATAVIRWERDQRLAAAAKREGEDRSKSVGDSVGFVDDRTELAIVAHLTRVGAATPRDLCIALGLARMTIARKLARLRATGVLAVTGKTRAACYRLRSEPGAIVRPPKR